MPTRSIGLLVGGLLLLSAVPALAADAFDVRVRIEGKHRTLVKERKATLADAPVNKDTDPSHACSGQSALGALQTATGGNWEGTYSEGLGYYVSTIMGEKASGNDFFELWVGHKESTSGFCDHTLKAGESVLIFSQTCVYDPKTQLCPEEVTPLGLRIPSRIKKGSVRTLTVVDYTPAGKATPQPGATVFFNGHRKYKTNAKGQVHFKALTTGVANVYATKTGHVRSETDTVRVVA
jgi:hypothetical protein